MCDSSAYGGSVFVCYYNGVRIVYFELLYCLLRGLGVLGMEMRFFCGVFRCSD